MTYLDLSNHIEGICISCIREIDADERIDNIVRVACNTTEAVPEVCVRILDMRSASENNKTSDCNEHQDDQLDG